MLDLKVPEDKKSAGDKFIEYYGSTIQVTSERSSKTYNSIRNLKRRGNLRNFLRFYPHEFTCRSNEDNDKILCLVPCDKTQMLTYERDRRFRLVAYFCKLEILIDYNKYCDDSINHPVIMFIKRAGFKKPEKPKTQKSVLWVSRGYWTGDLVGTMIIEKNEIKWVPGVDLTA